MTIDERLEKLTERHEALTQTVEIVAGMQRENERQIAELSTFIRQLAEIALPHERRLDDLENQ
ncbi:MAG: hypothetical protein C5B51_23155 [Terriglobia bacterium]|nr:MAG: hypothetical protein C5B51_23155 [Terriglobia bacterium]